jgi:hypothetical protein
MEKFVIRQEHSVTHVLRYLPNNLENKIFWRQE